MKQLGRHGFSAAVTLSRFNKKTSDTDRVRFVMPKDLMRGTSTAEAKHYGAVYALHRFNHRTNMHLMLPPSMKDFWIHLESMRKASGKHQEWMYLADPFAQLPPAPTLRIDHEASKAERVEAAAARYYDNAPTVRMSEENRKLVEQVIKDAGITMLDSDDSETLLSSSAASRLTKLGFRRSHVEEALKYTKSEDAALDWLCLYVPEDDLPKSFLPQNLNPTMRAQAHDTTSLALSWTIDRMSNIGYPKAACEDALIASQGDEGRAMEELQMRLLNEDLPPLPSVDKEEAMAMRDDELSALEAIYDHRYRRKDQDTIHIRILSTQKARESSLVVRFHPHSLYPFADPILAIDADLPSYIKLHCIKSLLTEIERQQLHGSPMISLLVEWLDENLDRLIDHPPELKATTEGLVQMQVQNQKVVSVASRRNGQTASKRHRQRATKNSKALLEDLERLHASAAYSTINDIRSKLPAASFADEVTSIIGKHNVVIVSGETGCGKTTQVPQFILDDMIRRGHGANANIVVTQPRRISALGVASRVAKERCESIGSSVGYAIRGESRVSGDTRLLFCTTGVLLRRIQSDANLEDVSHIIIDEVHERSVDTDVLLILMRKLLKRRKDLKVVLMSATLSQATFSDYFGGAPLVTIPGFTHPVKSHYLEDVLTRIECVPEDTRQRKKDEIEDDEYSGFDQGQINTLKASESRGVGYDLIAAAVKHILQTSNDGAILVFVSGVMEIKRSIDAINEVCGKQGIQVLPLHAGLTPQEQNRVFDKLSARKIVVSTNVAETSITIEDVVYVVDTGRVKETRFDPANNLVSLTETWASRANTRQRRGRAGRTRPGECYHLYTKRTESRMASEQVPEMLRLPMEQLSLQVKSMQEDENESVSDFLSQALSPPATSGLEKAWKTLVEMNAVEESGNLTALGRHMAMIPADLRIAKMLIYGAMFSCLDKVLSVAGIMSGRSIFVSPMDKREESRKARERFSSSTSDLLTDVAAFEAWQEMRDAKVPRYELESFCRENYLSSAALHEVVSLRRQYLDALFEIGFIDRKDDHSKHCQNDNLVKAIIMAGLYPNIAKVKLPQTKFDKSISGTVEREHESREIRFFLKNEGRAFLHPSSILFSHSSYPTTFIAYFSKLATSKLFIRDATEVPLYALLLFGGVVRVDHLGKGLTIGDDWIRMKAWARIGVLVNHLRRLLDTLLESKVQNPSIEMESSEVVKVMLKLLDHDGQ